MINPRRIGRSVSFSPQVGPRRIGPNSIGDHMRSKRKTLPGERQDVFRGTVFACGVNELGQLGTGEDLPWSGQPVRVVALKEVRWRGGELGCCSVPIPIQNRFKF